MVGRNVGPSRRGAAVARAGRDRMRRGQSQHLSAGREGSRHHFGSRGAGCKQQGQSRRSPSQRLRLAVQRLRGALAGRPRRHGGQLAGWSRRHWGRGLRRRIDSAAASLRLIASSPSCAAFRRPDAGRVTCAVRGRVASGLTPCVSPRHSTTRVSTILTTCRFLVSMSRSDAARRCCCPHIIVVSTTTFYSYSLRFY